MKKSFPLDPGGPHRLIVNVPAKLVNATVLLDGQQIISFPTKEDFFRGTTVKLPDASVLTVRYATIEGFWYLKGIHVIRNGKPIPGSAADPVPKWALVFIVLSALIPIISLGGMIPVLFGMAGVGGTLSVSRMSRWTTAVRAGVSTLVVVACWTGFLLVAGFVDALRVGANSVSTDKPASNSNYKQTDQDKLINRIGSTYYKRGYLQSDIDKKEDALYGYCDTVKPSECMHYLDQALTEAQNAPIQP